MEKIPFCEVRFSTDRALIGLLSCLDRLSAEGRWDGGMRVRVYVDGNSDYCALEGAGRYSFLHVSGCHRPEEAVFPSPVEECSLREFCCYAYSQWLFRRNGAPPV